MKLRAYNRLITKEGRLVDGPLVVVMDDDGTVVSYHGLEGEEPMTEWVGGTFTMCESS